METRVADPYLYYVYCRGSHGIRSEAPFIPKVVWGSFLKKECKPPNRWSPYKAREGACPHLGEVSVTIQGVSAPLVSDWRAHENLSK